MTDEEYREIRINDLTYIDDKIDYGFCQGFELGIKSVTPKEKTGHWIDDADKVDAAFGRHTYKCSECSKYAEYFVSGTEVWWDRIKPNFCPNCGAKMVNDKSERKCNVMTDENMYEKLNQLLETCTDEESKEALKMAINGLKYIENELKLVDDIVIKILNNKDETIANIVFRTDGFHYIISEEEMTGCFVHDVDSYNDNEVTYKINLDIENEDKLERSEKDEKYGNY